MRGISLLVVCTLATAALAQLSIPIPCFNEYAATACSRDLQIIPPGTYCSFFVLNSPSCPGVTQGGEDGVSGYTSYTQFCDYYVSWTITDGSGGCTTTQLRHDPISCVTTVPWAPCGS